MISAAGGDFLLEAKMQLTWRTVSGMAAHDINTIVNYDPCVLPFLDVAAGSPFERARETFRLIGDGNCGDCFPQQSCLRGWAVNDNVADSLAGTYRHAMVHPLTVSVLMFAAVGPQVLPLEEGRFRVRIVFDDNSVAGNVNAQIALISAARKNCKGRGVATSKGTLELNKAEPIRKGRKALELSEVYRCVSKT
jgi:hypothetical protein